MVTASVLSWKMTVFKSFDQKTLLLDSSKTQLELFFTRRSNCCLFFSMFLIYQPSGGHKLFPYSDESLFSQLIRVWLLNTPSEKSTVISQRQRFTPHLGQVKHVGDHVDGWPVWFLGVCLCVVNLCFWWPSRGAHMGQRQANTHGQCFLVCI